MRILQEEGEQAGEEKGEIHYKMMVIVWLMAGNIGLWSQAFKQYKWANIVHFYAMGILTIITWMSGFMAIIEFGVPNDFGDFHTGLGIAVMIVLVLQCVGGMMCWSLQRTSKINPSIIPTINTVHHIFGWIVLILGLIQLLVATREEQTQLFVLVIIISLISYVAYLSLRFFRRRMQAYSKIQQQDIEGVPIVKSTTDLTQYHGEYFIFADKIYDVGNVITNHPGGYEVIRSIKGREVDRFIYGSEPLETFDHMKIHNHSSSSMSMAGEPIGFLSSICPFSHMEQLNEMYLEYMAMPCKSQEIYAPYLLPKNKDFLYNGYSDLSQIGKYYAVTIQNKKTRLYTLVNFIQISNLELMTRITGVSYANKYSSKEGHTMASFEMISPDIKQNPNSIPLLIKKYANGDFTSTFLTQSFQGDIQISKPRGRGMSLVQIPPGRIIMFAGGTGLHPYSDLIDLLFKEVLLDQGNVHANEIASKNPLTVQKSLLQRFKFTLYLAVHNANEIHDITAYQLNFLSQNKVMQVHLKATNNADIFRKKYPAISIMNDKFDAVVPSLSNHINEISQIYICGPPVMARSLSVSLLGNKIPESKIRAL